MENLNKNEEISNVEIKRGAKYNIFIISTVACFVIGVIGFGTFYISFESWTSHRIIAYYCLLFLIPAFILLLIGIKIFKYNRNVIKYVILISGVFFVIYLAIIPLFKNILISEEKRIVGTTWYESPDIFTQSKTSWIHFNNDQFSRSYNENEITDGRYFFSNSKLILQYRGGPVIITDYYFSTDMYGRKILIFDDKWFVKEK